jgi:hypothetical protein
MQSISSEISKRCPSVYEKLKLIENSINWNEMFDQLEKLNWLLTPSSVELVLHNALKLIEGVMPDKFSVIKLETVQFHINSLVFELCIDKKYCKRYTKDFVATLSTLSFFRNDSNLALDRIERIFCLISSLVHICFMHLELYFLKETKKTIPEYLKDIFYNTCIHPNIDELSGNQAGIEILYKYPKPRFMYIPYFTKVSSPMNNYFGEYQDSLKHGYGLQSFMNGDLYRGEHCKDLMHGKGTYYWSHGGYYQGELREGNLHGLGCEHYVSGNVYTGEFVSGKKHGKGEMEYANGDKYIGEWKDNMMDGEGEFYWSSGVVFRGWFNNDKRNGNGEITMENGVKYNLEWNNDQVIS